MAHVVDTTSLSQDDFVQEMEYMVKIMANYNYKIGFSSYLYGLR